MSMGAGLGNTGKWFSHLHRVANIQPPIAASLTKLPYRRGCVSGAQLLHLREACDTGDGKYDFDAIDGYDELGLVFLVPRLSPWRGTRD